MIVEYGVSYWSLSDLYLNIPQSFDLSDGLLCGLNEIRSILYNAWPPSA